MSKKRETPSGMFMMEMIMVVFFFILCASTCILVFVKANNMSRQAKDLNQGVLMVESIVEIWKAEGEKGLTEKVGAQAHGDGKPRYDVYWNQDWKPATGEAEAVYRGDITLSEKDGMSYAEVVIFKMEDNDEVFRLEAQKYRRTVREDG
ncbi:hypothetical protein C0033_06500 [Clostridium sp. chh4-2]|uniref:hypothetical protein n=1 Tax=Clostridium sp. chh4-2 TaxID=2067550 RepID=UPI000CCE9E91|nr:hypothetical protein [Clostridium sp. chh4-2]PNV62678.1 hypothetical protein C0033_06500 [Clostridium sp. chh4-2]